MGRGVFLGGQPRPPQWGGALQAAQRSPMFGVPFHTHSFGAELYRISTWQHLWGGEIVFRYQSRPHPKGIGPLQHPQFWCYYTFIAKLPNLTWKHMWVRGVYLGVSHARLPSQESGVMAPQLLAFSCICLHPLTQNDQIRNGNTYTGRACFQEVSHVVFAQMRRAVCRRQLSFLL